MNHFKLMAKEINVEPILKGLRDNVELWKQITIRQEFPNTAHHDTETIFIRGPSEFSFEEYMGTVEAYDYAASVVLEKQLLPTIVEVLNVLDAKELGYVLIVNLKPNGSIDLHRDEGKYAEHYARYHLVLTSDEGNLFTVGTESVHMKAGELWWFDHRIEHCVTNNSHTDRIHIILDAVPADISFLPRANE